MSKWAKNSQVYKKSLKCSNMLLIFKKEKICYASCTKIIMKAKKILVNQRRKKEYWVSKYLRKKIKTEIILKLIKKISWWMELFSPILFHQKNKNKYS
jgi:hypothetical protein